MTVIRDVARFRLTALGIILIPLLALLPWVTSGTAAAQSTPIQHIVVLYLENHSFDSLLGYWCDDHPARGCLGMPASVRLKNGTVVRPSVSPDVVPTVQHTVSAQQTAIDGGKMDGWKGVSGCGLKSHYACVSGYKPAQVPNLINLATKFAISDQTFSMADSPSYGGHLYAVMGSNDGFTGDIPVPAPGVPPGQGWGCNSDLITQWQRHLTSPLQWVPSCVPDRNLGLPYGGAFESTPVSYAPTIMDRLQAAGLSWRIYGEPKPGGAKSTGYGWDICPSIAECLDTTQASNNLPSAQFVTDAAAGHLPAFSIVTPGGPYAKDSEHNGFSMTAGDNWLGQVAKAVMNGPEWRSTVLFITWDDCGCFYDQVPPGTNPDGTPQGPRVPLVIVSPYAKPAYTDTTPTTFSGILAYTEQTFKLASLGPNVAQAYPFTNAFNYSQRPLGPARVVQRPLPPWAYHVNMKNADEDT
jgi:phospholipase C